MTDNDSLTQLQTSLRCNDTKALHDKLTELCATLSKEDYEFTTHPLISEAIENEWHNAVERLLQNVVPFNTQHITSATLKSSYRTLEALLRHGWDINVPIDMYTSLALAFSSHDAGLTRWFLALGADPNRRYYQYTDKTPLSVAFEKASFSIIKLLLEHGGSLQTGQLIHYAALRESDDRLRVIQFLIDQGLPTDEVMYQNCGDEYYFNMYSGIGTPVHYATGRGLLDSVKLLVQNGASPRIKSPSGQNAADWARRYNDEDVISFLRPLVEGPDSDDLFQFTDQPGRNFELSSLDDLVAENGFVLL